MSGFFLNIVNMSISASWIVLVVLLLRLLLKKAPKWITVLLWGVVAVRLICPFSIESVMSLIPSAETINPEIMMDRTPEINAGVPIINNTINQIITGSLAPALEASANPLQIWIPVLAFAWIVGIISLLIYTVISYFRVKSKIGTAVLLRDNIYQSENVVSPFVLGIIKPRIYLPFNMNQQNMGHVIAHENAHIRRKDHLWKPFGFLTLTLHWFNPLMWLGYVLLCRDIELACDEKVVKNLNVEQKADYSQALLTCSVNRRVIAACPLAFGEVDVKDRVKSVLNYKKPALWIIVVAVIASIVVAICFLTNPVSNTLKNIEFLNLTSRIDNTVSISLWDGETFTPAGAVNKGLLNELCNIKISRNEVSLNRSEDRDKTHTLVLQTQKDTEPSIYSYVEGCYICFDSTFTSVWVNNNVKPTLSYRVINPLKAKQIYEDIANYKDNPFNQGYDVVLSYANWTENSKIYTNALNSNKMQSDSFQHLPIYKFHTADELQQFKTMFGDVLTMDRGWDEVPSFNNATAKYGKEFFDKNSLLLIYIPATSCTYRYDLADVSWNGNSVYLHVAETTGAEFVDNAMGGWFLTIAVPNETLAKCTEFDASFATTVTTKPSSSATITTPTQSSSTTTTTTLPRPSSAKFTPIKAYTDCPQVQVSIKEINQQDDDVIVVIEQRNQSDDVLSYGTQLFLYRVEGDDMVDCRPKDYRWNAILHQQFAGSTTERKLNLSGFDVFVEGDYQLQYAFSVNGQQHKACFEFSVVLD